MVNLRWCSCGVCTCISHRCASPQLRCSVHRARGWNTGVQRVERRGVDQGSKEGGPRQQSAYLSCPCLEEKRRPTRLYFGPSVRRHRSKARHDKLLDMYYPGSMPLRRVHDGNSFRMRDPKSFCGQSGSLAVLLPNMTGLLYRSPALPSHRAIPSVWHRGVFTRTRDATLRGSKAASPPTSAIKQVQHGRRRRARLLLYHAAIFAPRSGRTTCRSDPYLTAGRLSLLDMSAPMAHLALYRSADDAMDVALLDDAYQGHDRGSTQDLTRKCRLRTLYVEGSLGSDMRNIRDEVLVRRLTRIAAIGIGPGWLPLRMLHTQRSKALPDNESEHHDTLGL